MLDPRTQERTCRASGPVRPPAQSALENRSKLLRNGADPKACAILNDASIGDQPFVIFTTEDVLIAAHRQVVGRMERGAAIAIGLLHPLPGTTLALATVQFLNP